MDDKIEIMDTTYLQYCGILNDADRAIEKEPARKERVITAYMSTFAEFCRNNPEMARVVIADNRQVTGIDITQEGVYYHAKRQYSPAMKELIHPDSALELSLLAIQIQIDMDHETTTTLLSYLKNEGSFEPDFERCASAVYQKVMMDRQPKPKKENLFDDEAEDDDIKVEQTDPSYRPGRQGSHCSGTIDANKKYPDLKKTVQGYTKPAITIQGQEYHENLLRMFN